MRRSIDPPMRGHLIILHMASFFPAPAPTFFWLIIIWYRASVRQMETQWPVHVSAGHRARAKKAKE